MKRWTLVFLLFGCGGKDDPPDSLLETGWFVDTASYDPETCRHRLVETQPADGVQDWYWRDGPRVFLETDKPERYSITLRQASGVEVDAELKWAEQGLSANFLLNAPLRPRTSYVLEVTDCAERHEIAFRTSDLGRPIDGGPETLRGKTWVLDLVGSDWLEPVGISGLMQLYFTTPVLFGVTMVDEQRIDFLAAPGYRDIFGQLHQNLAERSWDFPIADFSEQPYFDAESDGVVFYFEGTEVPVNHFRFTGTISSDGSRIGGGVLSGLGDTRHMGPLINEGDKPSAVCDLAASLGVQCQPCPDGEPYCLFMHAVNVRGNQVPGLSLSTRH